MGILYKLFYSNANTTQEDAVIKVNSFKTHETCSRQALVKKEDLIPVQVYVELSILLNSNIHDILYKNITQNNNLIIIAVDGTYSTMKESLCNDGYKSNKNGESVTALITGMFNVTCNCPIGLHITKHKNERKAFMDLITEYPSYKYSVFVFDRGYFSEDMFDFMNDNKLFYICRMRENSLLIDSTKDDFTTKMKNGAGIRIVKYTINKKNYYMATNLLDAKHFPISFIKENYGHRWTVEEYFKYVKQTLSLSKLQESKERNVIKTIYSHLITSQITYMFTILNKEMENKSKKINKSLLTTGIMDTCCLFFA